MLDAALDVRDAPAAVGVTTMVTVALPPLAMLPSAQLTVAPAVQVPWLGVAETRLALAGKVFVRLVAVAISGPRFVTTNV